MTGALQETLTEMATRLEVPGVAAGVLLAGEEEYAFGVTSVENPLPVQEETLFQFGSTGKTFTATAMLRLVDQGRVDLDAPVRTYVPELRLQDEDVAQHVTVLQLFNHTAGWAGDLMDDTGAGDDALEKYVARMETLAQITPLVPASATTMPRSPWPDGLSRRSPAQPTSRPSGICSRRSASTTPSSS
jgi:CubicO group peptidase (beta-lactamase class C family)